MPEYYTHAKVKQGGPDYAKANADQLVAVVAPTKADTWAAFQAKIIATAAITNTDWIYTYEGENLRITTNPKSDVDPTASVTGVEDLCMAAIDTVNEEVLIVQDATDRVITNETSDRVTLPGLNYLEPELVAE